MTYEEELNALWTTYGPEVRTEDVPALVRSGVTVYSFGYGEDDAVEEGFDALDESDLWAFEGPEADSDIVESWAPFRLDPVTTPVDLVDRFTV
jgi:hypothetical protein